jgi:hypothetical protein
MFSARQHVWSDRYVVLTANEDITQILEREENFQELNLNL